MILVSSEYPQSANYLKYKYPLASYLFKDTLGARSKIFKKLASRCAYRSVQSIREIIRDGVTSRRNLRLVLSQPIIREAVYYRRMGRFRVWDVEFFEEGDVRVAGRCLRVNVYVFSDEQELFPSLYDCSSHRRVLLLFPFIFPLLCFPPRVRLG